MYYIVRDLNLNNIFFDLYLQNTVNIVNKIEINAPAPNKDGNLVNMPHIVGCINN